MTRGSRAIAAAALATGAYACLVWFDVPGSGAPDHITTAAGGMAVGADPWWNQIHGLRGWGGFYGSGGTGAYFVQLPVPPLVRWLPLLAVIAAGAALVARAVRRPAASQWRSLALLVVLAYLMQFSALWLHVDNPSGAVASRQYAPVYGGYVRGADTAYGISTFFGGYERLLETRHGDDLCPTHCGTHPPGAVLAYWVPIAALRELPQDSRSSIAAFVSNDLDADLPSTMSPEGGVVAWVGGHLTMLGAALIALPLFGLARRLAGPRLALPLAALGVTTPGMLHFAPVYDQVWAVAAATLLYLAVRGLTATVRPAAWGLAAGVLLGLSTYGSLQVAVLVLPLVAIAAAALLGKLPAADGAVVRAPRPHVVRWLAALAIGGAAPWLLAWAGGLDVPAVIDSARQNHVASTLSTRPYGPWLLFNLTDYLQFLGLPLAAVAIAVSLRRRVTGSPVAARNLYGLVFVGLLLTLDLSGTVRGETGRIWLFVTPLALMSVYLAAGRRQIGPRGVAVLLAAQTAVSVLLEVRWSYQG